MNPKGGTEIQLEELTKRLPKHYWNKISITTSVPEKTQIDPARLNILLQKNSYDQPNLRPWFLKKENHVKYDWYVFNSHWNYEKFRIHLIFLLLGVLLLKMHYLNLNGSLKNITKKAKL